jgi:phenylpropionate dioxygenase-like ring-hydroxylating dioxygenase large terminal subunit
MSVKINFDMDGTLVNLYGVEDWLKKLVAEDETPYIDAKPCIDLRVFAIMINRLKRNGYEIGVISWLSKKGSPDYNRRVTKAKLEWLQKHLPSVEWDSIEIVPYGTQKERFNMGGDILFDDEQKNREEWTGFAFNEKNIIEILRSLRKRG